MVKHSPKILASEEKATAIALMAFSEVLCTPVKSWMIWNLSFFLSGLTVTTPPRGTVRAEIKGTSLLKTSCIPQLADEVKKTKQKTLRILS